MSKEVLDSVVAEFTEITKIPRPSYHEERIVKYLYDWAVDKGLEAEIDDLGQVIIHKKASPGLENTATTILQAHVDMVCVADKDIEYDPVNTPIKLVNDGEYLSAEATSLGADDGIGVAMALHILKSKDLKHGPIRVLFTVREETDMYSQNTDAKYLTGEYLINLDWEMIGSLCNSCAGADCYDFSLNYDLADLDMDYSKFELSFSDFEGGHSGIEINKGRANAIVALATLLSSFRFSDIDFRLNKIQGGQAKNAIPKEAFAYLAVNNKDLDKAKAVYEEFKMEFEQAFSELEKDYRINLELKQDLFGDEVMPEEIGYNLVEILTSAPNNIHTISPYIQGLVESSSNLGILKTDTVSKKIEFSVFARSSVLWHSKQIGMICKSLAKHYNFNINESVHIPGWAYKPGSRLTTLACNTYKELTGQDMVVEPVHAGLECGAFAIKNPNLDMISIGPTLIGVHTPKEKCVLKDVETVTVLLEKIIENIYR